MKFFLNTNFIIEHGSSHGMARLIKENVGSVSSPALIYDHILDGQSHFDKAFKNLKKAFPKIDIKVNNRQGEPTYRYLNEFADHFRGKDIDAVIAIGGGSTMDLGKGVAFLLTNKGDALEYKGFPKDVSDPIPLITCPSLFGSGADVSYNAVFIDENEGRKLGINSTRNFPVLAIMDAELTMEAPESAVISSAMDTLVHCIDSFGSVRHTPMSRMFSIEGFKNTSEVLCDDILDKPHMDLQNRDRLALGSICGITALMNSGDGPTNGFAYYLGVKYNVPHGLAGAIFLNEVIYYNVDVKDYDEYALFINPDGPFTDINNPPILNFLGGIHTIYDKLKIPNLASFGFSENDMDEFVKGSMNALAGSFAGNPVEFGEDAVRHVYKKLVEEK